MPILDTLNLVDDCSHVKYLQSLSSLLYSTLLLSPPSQCIQLALQTSCELPAEQTLQMPASWLVAEEFSITSEQPKL